MAGPTKVKDSVADLTASGASGPWIDVTTIAGVVANGTTDVAAAINAAIAAAPAKVYYFPEGTYLFESDSLTILDKTSIIGAGKDLVTIKNTSFASIFGGPLVNLSASGGSGQCISGITFSYLGNTTTNTNSTIIKVDGNSQIDITQCAFVDQSTAGTEFCVGISVGGWYSPASVAPNVSGIRIYDNYFNIAYHGIEITGGSDSLYVQNNDMYINRAGSFSSRSILLRLCNNALIEGNTASSPIRLEGCQYCSINNNQVVAGYDTSITPLISLNASGTVYSTYNQLRGNSAINSAYSANALYIAASCSHNSVTDNNFSVGGTSINNVEIRGTYCAVVGNYINKGDSGIYVVSGTGIRVTDNRVLGQQTACVYFDTSGSNVVVSNNYLEMPSNGYNIYCTSYQQILIENNNIKALNGLVIDLEGCAYAVVSGNSIYTGDKAVRLINCSSVRVDGNVFQSPNSAIYTDGITNGVFVNNIVVSAAYIAIRIDSNTYGTTRELNVSNNVISSPANKAIDLTSSGINVVVSGNQINSAASGGPAINLAGTQITANGNNVRGGSPTYGIYMNGCTNSVAVGNNCAGVTATVAQYDLTGVTASTNI